MLLVDVSASIGDRQLDAARKLVEDARAARHGDDVLRLVTFGAHPRLVELPPDGTPLPADALARHDVDGSDLAAALHARPTASIRRARCRARILVSDGNETEGDVAAEAAEAARRGVRVSAVSFPRAANDEVLVRSLTLPSDVKVGAPFEVTAEVYSSRAQPATLTLYRDEFINPLDGRKTRARSRPAPTRSSGRPRWRRPASPPSRRSSLGAGKEKLHDTLAGNNAAVASVSVKGKPRVLYVEGEPAAAAYLANALKRESIDVDVRTSYGLPSSPRELARLRPGAS